MSNSHTCSSQNQEVIHVQQRSSATNLLFSLALQVQSYLKKCKEINTCHFTVDPSLIHPETEEEWHAHALTLVISLPNPLIRQEQKLVPGNCVLLTCQLLFAYGQFAEQPQQGLMKGHCFISTPRPQSRRQGPNISAWSKRGRGGAFENRGALWVKVAKMH